MNPEMSVTRPAWRGVLSRILQNLLKNLSVQVAVVVCLVLAVVLAAATASFNTAIQHSVVIQHNVSAVKDPPWTTKCVQFYKDVTDPAELVGGTYNFPGGARKLVIAVLDKETMGCDDGYFAVVLKDQ